MGVFATPILRVGLWVLAGVAGGVVALIVGLAVIDARMENAEAAERKRTPLSRKDD